LQPVIRGKHPRKIPEIRHARAGQSDRSIGESPIQHDILEDQPMTHLITRRAFLRGSASLTAAAALTSLAPWQRALAQAATTLTISRRTLEVKGRAASVFGILQSDGASGLTIEPGDAFRVNLVNNAGEGTLVHWHGQRPPYLQDGFPDKQRPLIQTGESHSYDYASTPGTHWMHSHQGLQEQSLLTAPLIVRTKEDVAADVQEVTVFLSDFTFRDPEEILASLTGKKVGEAGMAMGNGSGMAGMDHSAMKTDAPKEPAADMGMKDMAGMKDMGGMKMDAPKPAAEGGMDMGAKPDLNDVDYDAFIANDRTLDDPLVAQVDRRGRVRLRIINGSSSTAYWIDLGTLTGTVIAADGNDVAPVSGTRFPLAIAQRLDILVDVSAGGAYPVFAQVEGKKDRTGIVLATAGAEIKKIAGLADSEAPPVDLSLEMKLSALSPLAERPANIVVPMALTGSMATYVWSLNDQIWPNVDRPVIREGQRVVIELQNKTAMAHPMHFHGHAFQVLALNGTELKGALRDTIHVPPNGSARVAFDADNPGRWPLHCHNLYHMEVGMLTELVYEGYA
jgi:FtsP/CotA-like multicopper oxidase with cupredoxin domain